MVKFENERQRNAYLTDIFRALNFKRDREETKSLPKIWEDNHYPRFPLDSFILQLLLYFYFSLEGKKQVDTKNWKRGT